MATAKKLPSGSWRVRVYTHTDASGKKCYESFTAATKKQAELMAAQYAVKKNDRLKQKMTFGEAVAAYIHSREDVLSPSTIAAYRSIARTHMKNIMPVSIDRLTESDLQMMINAEARAGLAPKTLRNITGLITATLKAYRPDFSFYLELPKRQRAEIYIPSDEDMKKIMAEISGTEMELPVMLAAFGPMRRGEICALRTDNINGTVVHVCEAIVETKISDDPLRVKTPKTYAGDRYITYPDFVAARWQGLEGRVTQLTPAAITHRFTRILHRLGLPHFRFHDLRHYSASIQHALGIPDQYIMQRGGWATDSTLKAVYRHSVSDVQSQMDQKANDFFARYDTKYDTKAE